MVSCQKMTRYEKLNYLTIYSYFGGIHKIRTQKWNDKIVLETFCKCMERTLSWNLHSLHYKAHILLDVTDDIFDLRTIERCSYSLLFLKAIPRHFSTLTIILTDALRQCYRKVCVARVNLSFVILKRKNRTNQSRIFRIPSFPELHYAGKRL